MLHAVQPGNSAMRSPCEAGTPDPMTLEPARNLLSPDVQHFSHLVHLIHEGVLETRALRRFLELLTIQLHGNSGILILRSSHLGEPPMSIVHGYVPRSDSSYFGYYMATDPFVQLPEGRAITMHDFVDTAELERSEYFREYLIPLDMVYALGVDLRDKGRYHVRLRICRPRQAGNFTATDCRYVEAFVPHLRTAMRIFAELDVMRSERGFYAEAMDQLTLATIVLNETGEILHANRLAESILATRDGLSRSNDTLMIDHHDDAKRFRELVVRAVEAQRTSRTGLVEVMRVRRPSGKPDISLAVRPSTSRTGLQNERLTNTVAVFLSTNTLDGDEKPPMSAEVIQKLFGLTPKEATLALHLAAGKSLLDAARTLNMSPNTARTHLRSVFAKTGVDRQASLVRVLLKSVAMLGQ